MRISLTKRLVFLSNPRSASTSVRNAMAGVSEFRSGVTCDLPHHSARRTVEA